MSASEDWLKLYALPPPAHRVKTCLCCGKCCEAFGGHLHASKQDVARWRAAGREDLLRRVSEIRLDLD